MLTLLESSLMFSLQFVNEADQFTRLASLPKSNIKLQSLSDIATSSRYIHWDT